MKRDTFLALLPMLFAATSAHSFSFEKAQQASASGLPQDAVRLASGCLKDERCNILLAQSFQDGVGVPKDTAKAKSLLDKAEQIKAQKAKAAIARAKTYHTGMTLSAAQWADMEIALAAGEESLKVLYAELMLNAKLPDYNKDRGISLLQGLVSEDNVEAQAALGIQIYLDAGSDSSAYLRAKHLLLSATEKGSSRAAYYLARLYEDSSWAESNAEQSNSYYQLSADRGSPEAHLLLAKRALGDLLDVLLSDSDDSSLSGKPEYIDFAKASMVNLDKASSLGNGQASYLLSVLYANSLLGEDLTEVQRQQKSVDLLELSAGQGYAQANLDLYRRLAADNTNPKKVLLALIVLKAASDAGSPEANRILSRLSAPPEDSVAIIERLSATYQQKGYEALSTAVNQIF